MKDLSVEIKSLREYIEKEEFKGYDPYDTLLSTNPIIKSGKWIPILAIQFQKRNPINIRPVLGIKKEYNPKGMGLLLHAYSLLYKKERLPIYKEKMEILFQWLKNNSSGGYSGYCWGYNFPWANPAHYLPAFIPSAVVTGFVCKGIFAYYQTTGNEEAKDVLKSAEKFVLNDLPATADETGLCISYTPEGRDICYNASLLAGEILAMNYSLFNDGEALIKAIKIVDFVVSRQKNSGVWAYSEDPESAKERMQIDFHQGYVLSSIYNILTLIKETGQLTPSSDINWIEKQKSWEEAIKKGCEYYRVNQFQDNGSSYWRLPKKWPVDIHNQTQGIITFTQLKNLCPEHTDFAGTIFEWTTDHMKSRGKYYYYQRFRFFVHKIPYMRWSQAWTLLSFAHLNLVTGK